MTRRKFDEDCRESAVRLARETANLARQRARSIGPSPEINELEKSVAQAAVRETLAQSGTQCAIIGILVFYSDPRYVILYTSNGEARQEVSMVLTGRPLSGQPTPSSESSDVWWVRPSELPGYAMERSMRIRINDFLARKETPVIT